MAEALPDAGEDAAAAMMPPRRGAKEMTFSLRCLKDKLVPIGVTVLVAALLIAVIALAARKCPSCPSPILPSCSGNGIGFGEKCFYFVEDEADWNRSRSFCLSRRAQLATIDSREDLRFLLRYGRALHYWVGLQREGSDPWRWINGSLFNNLFAEVATPRSNSVELWDRRILCPLVSLRRLRRDLGISKRAGKNIYPALRSLILRAWCPCLGDSEVGGERESWRNEAELKPRSSGAAFWHPGAVPHPVCALPWPPRAKPCLNLGGLFLANPMQQRAARVGAELPLPHRRAGVRPPFPHHRQPGEHREHDFNQPHTLGCCLQQQRFISSDDFFFFPQKKAP
ncbi:uncharacterized protein LOC118159903 isoform X1 [Oxyura jamaicensis]|uniref:uncharacterized protein LOC118159903 isoform X1 n=1 Tax=Oxyura jamaicensis TaxID=8884 RepID=UPI0015A71466|nr:uncharacterized protein LOC118159903 isoform X1 [Oxyura jamaicensis]XP_035170325.1 uncharacterized protein LOC118159903 isoform X1 [Oxyura jamaicensis]XP_035170326.1 uncharacterized protein LOC118159903 isoform X1 [Oxyura jamaicensis]